MRVGLLSFSHGHKTCRLKTQAFASPGVKRDRVWGGRRYAKSADSRTVAHTRDGRTRLAKDCQGVGARSIPWLEEALTIPGKSGAFPLTPLLLSVKYPQATFEAVPW